MINPVVKYTSAEQSHFTDKELAEGYRLACQHFSDDIEDMSIIDVTKAQKHTLELIQFFFISPVTKELKFKVKGGKSISYKAGAFMRFLSPASKTNTIPLALSDKLNLIGSILRIGLLSMPLAVEIILVACHRSLPKNWYSRLKSSQHLKKVYSQVLLPIIYVLLV
jgi:hypothetical protein